MTQLTALLWRRRTLHAGLITLAAIFFILQAVDSAFSLTGIDDELSGELSLPAFNFASFSNEGLSITDLRNVEFAIDENDDDDNAGWMESPDGHAGLRVVEHVVKPGESLSKIAARYGISLATVASFNRIGTTITVGQVLQIPNRDGLMVEAGKSRSVWDLTKIYRVSADDILSSNSIDDPNEIAAGTRLFLPGAKAPSSAAPPRERTASRGRIVWPVAKSRLTSKFGYRRHPITRRIAFHRGVDFAAPRGAPVLSVKAGTVVFSGRRGGYGLTIDVRHADGVITRYAHNSKLLVKVGARVSAGTAIAKVGSTGHSTGPHVHLEVIRKGEKINPLKYLGRG